MSTLLSKSEPPNGSRGFLRAGVRSGEVSGMKIRRLLAWSLVVLVGFCTGCSYFRWGERTPAEQEDRARLHPTNGPTLQL
ncbi:MAG TPA: hypothetical protein VK530_11980, partial [Candidatus Acidoferrum sp.]|nr:hypothetical protein [Candidatus Acidoferrum sp.]